MCSRVMLPLRSLREDPSLLLPVCNSPGCFWLWGNIPAVSASIFIWPSSLHLCLFPKFPLLKGRGKWRGGHQRGDEPWETMNSGKQSEGFRREGGGGWVSPVMGIKEGRYCMEHRVLYTMNHGTVHQKLMVYCMVTNIKKKHKTLVILEFQYDLILTNYICSYPISK